MICLSIFKQIQGLISVLPITAHIRKKEFEIHHLLFVCMLCMSLLKTDSQPVRNVESTLLLLLCNSTHRLKPASLIYSTLQLNPVFYSNLSSCLQLSGLQSFSGLYSLPKDTLPSNLHFLAFPFHFYFYPLSLVLLGLYTWCTVNLFRECMLLLFISYYIYGFISNVFFCSGMYMYIKLLWELGFLYPSIIKDRSMHLLRAKLVLFTNPSFHQ